MTRKDYIAIAAAISTARRVTPSKAQQSALDDVQALLAQHMAADNARFDRARFLKACEVQS